VIEDSAEAHGAKCNDRYCGTLGDVAAFSFYANKIITTGEGGMVVTDDEAIANKARYYRNLCFQPKQRFWHEDLGYNFRMTNLQAAIGLAQVEKFEDLLKIKREQGALYSKLLRNVRYLRIQKVEPWASHVYWVFGLLIDEDAPFDAKALSDRLLKRGVQTRPFFWPLNEQPVLKRMGLFNNEDYPVAQRLGRKGLYVPSGMALGVSEQEEVAEKLRDSVTELCNEK
jgi:perosamine synthetase